MHESAPTVSQGSPSQRTRCVVVYASRRALPLSLWCECTFDRLVSLPRIAYSLKRHLENLASSRPSNQSELGFRFMPIYGKSRGDRWWGARPGWTIPFHDLPRGVSLSRIRFDRLIIIFLRFTQIIIIHQRIIQWFSVGFRWFLVNLSIKLSILTLRGSMGHCSTYHTRGKVHWWRCRLAISLTVLATRVSTWRESPSQPFVVDLQLHPRKSSCHLTHLIRF